MTYHSSHAAPPYNLYFTYYESHEYRRTSSPTHCPLTVSGRTKHCILRLLYSLLFRSCVSRQVLSINYVHHRTKQCRNYPHRMLFPPTVLHRLPKYSSSTCKWSLVSPARSTLQTSPLHFDTESYSCTPTTHGSTQTHLPSQTLNPQIIPSLVTGD